MAAAAAASVPRKSLISEEPVGAQPSQFQYIIDSITSLLESYRRYKNTDDLKTIAKNLQKNLKDKNLLKSKTSIIQYLSSQYFENYSEQEKK